MAYFGPATYARNSERTTLTDFRVEIAVACANNLGEAPCWDDRSGSLVWLDRPALAAYRWRLGEARWQRQALSEELTMIAPSGACGYVGVARSGVYLLDGGLTIMRRIVGSLDDAAVFRSNDGKADPRGRIVVGTIDVSLPREDRQLGRLFGLGTDLKSRVLAEGVAGSNGLGWSPDGTTLYHVDTTRRAVSAYGYDLDSGAAGPGSVLFSTEGLPGIPDGMTVDDLGCLWVAMYGGGLIIRLSPDGRLMDRVDLPTELVTSVCFGARGQRTLFATTASRDSTGRILNGAQPSGPAGAVLQIEAGIDGAASFPARLADAA